jgi:hypothetical protein
MMKWWIWGKLMQKGLGERSVSWSVTLASSRVYDGKVQTDAVHSAAPPSAAVRLFVNMGHNKTPLNG